jgi:hypothetical protein
MDSSSNPLFISTNYFQWKSLMEDLLRNIGLYRITLGKEKEPTDTDKKDKWDNRSDEACGPIGMSISPYLRFHLKEIDDHDEYWEKLESVFGKHNII